MNLDFLLLLLIKYGAFSDLEMKSRDIPPPFLSCLWHMYSVLSKRFQEADAVPEGRVP